MANDKILEWGRRSFVPQGPFTAITAIPALTLVVCGCQPSSFIDILVTLLRFMSSMFRKPSTKTRCVLPIKASSRLWTGCTVPSSVVLEKGTKGSARRSFCISSTIGISETIAARGRLSNKLQNCFTFQDYLNTMHRNRPDQVSVANHWRHAVLPTCATFPSRHVPDCF